MVVVKGAGAFDGDEAEESRFQSDGRAGRGFPIDPVDPVVVDAGAEDAEAGGGGK